MVVRKRRKKREVMIGSRRRVKELKKERAESIM